MPSSLSQPTTFTSRSAPAYSSGRNNTACTTLKIAVVAPMPSDSVMMATAAKPGFLARLRNA